MEGTKKRIIHAKIHSSKEEKLSRKSKLLHESSLPTDVPKSMKNQVINGFGLESTKTSIIANRDHHNTNKDSHWSQNNQYVPPMFSHSQGKTLSAASIGNSIGTQSSAVSFSGVTSSPISRSDASLMTEKAHRYRPGKIEPSYTPTGQTSTANSSEFKYPSAYKQKKRSDTRHRRWRNLMPIFLLCAVLLTILLGFMIAAIVFATRNTNKSEKTELMNNQTFAQTSVTTDWTTVSDTTTADGTSTETSLTTDWTTAPDTTTADETSASNSLITDVTTIGPVTYQPFGIFNLRIPSCATWNTTGTTVAGNRNGTIGSDLTSLDNPVTIFVDNNNTLYVADHDNHRIMKYHENSNVGVIAAGNGTRGNSARHLNSPRGVAIDQQGNLIVADSLNYRIQKFLVGSTSGITVVANSSSFIIGQTRDLQIDVNNNIYVTDSDFSRILRFSAFNGAGSILAGLSGSGSGSAQLNTPFGTHISNNQTMCIADSLNHRVQMWRPGATSGTTVAGVTGSSGLGSNQLFAPWAVRADENGHIFVADTRNNRVMKWTSNYLAGGQCIVGCSGIAGIGPTQLRGPRDIKFDARGNLYVSDQGNNRIQKFDIIYPANCTASG